MTIDTTQLSAGQQYLPLLSRLARTATPNQKQVNAEGAAVAALIVMLDVTAITATGTLTLKIEGVDPQTNDPYLILQGTAISTTGMFVYRVDRVLPAQANLTAQDVVPTRVRVTVAHGNAVSITYSVSAIFPE